MLLRVGRAGCTLSRTKDQYRLIYEQIMQMEQKKTHKNNYLYGLRRRNGARLYSANSAFILFAVRCLLARERRTLTTPPKLRLNISINLMQLLGQFATQTRTAG